MTKIYRILALEPYYSGSHRYFLDHWQQHSRHHITTLTLPGHKWQWRMRHSPVTFAGMVNNMVNDQQWDAVFCSEMLDLATFCGLVDQRVSTLPKIVFFHENQLTYPVQDEANRDYHSVFTNFTSALCADSVWFNSAFHRDDFLNNLPKFLQKMPDYRLRANAKTIDTKTHIQHLGITPITPAQRHVGTKTPSILWVARWEFDKNPEDFFNALSILKKKGYPFRLNVLGEQFRQSPDVFDWAKNEFNEHIDHWGFVDRETYSSVLAHSDIVVSTAIHEFFGLGILEAVSAGAYPVLPHRLAYPEIFAQDDICRDAFFYKQTASQLARKLMTLTCQLAQGIDIWEKVSFGRDMLADKFSWLSISKEIDESLAKIIDNYI